MLYVTHDQVEAMTLGDRIVVMHAGRIVQVGVPTDVYLHPRDTFVASFLGSPPMNLLAGTLERDGDQLGVRLTGAPDAVLLLPRALAGVAETAGVSSVILGLRPEDGAAVAVDDNASVSPGALTGVVELVEPLGHQQLLHLRVGTIAVTVQGAARERPPLGAKVVLRADAKSLHLFDAGTGKAIGH
jgi:multiple sugar transport system ATP-binding protein